MRRLMETFVLSTFLLLCGLLIFLFHFNMIMIPQPVSTHVQSREGANSSIRTNLLIVSQGRSGSSFLAELFNNHPDIIYVYEPLHSALRSLKEDKPESYKLYSSELLDSFFKCNFSRVRKALPKLSKSSFRVRSKALSGDLFCNSTKKHKQCASLTSEPLAKACRSYKHTVIKILSPRLPNKTIQSFRDKFEHADNYDVKFVNLVRDPRAVVYSWVTLKWIRDHTHPDFLPGVQKVCDPIEKNVRLSLSPPPWLRNRVIIVRYEDLVANTTTMARQLYSFAGFDWSPKVEEWIIEHKENPKKISARNAYSMYRNGTVAVSKWKEAPEEMIGVVEEICGDVMDLMGYKRSMRKEK